MRFVVVGVVVVVLALACISLFIVRLKCHSSSALVTCNFATTIEKNNFCVPKTSCDPSTTKNSNGICVPVVQDGSGSKEKDVTGIVLLSVSLVLLTMLVITHSTWLTRSNRDTTRAVHDHITNTRADNYAESRASLYQIDDDNSSIGSEWSSRGNDDDDDTEHIPPQQRPAPAQGLLNFPWFPTT